MGASVTKNMQPDDLAEFKEFKDNGPIQIPELSRNRVPTDKKYIAIFVAMVLLLVPCLIYTLRHSNYQELVKNTKKYKDVNCSYNCVYVFGIAYSGVPELTEYGDFPGYSRFGNHSVQYHRRDRRDTNSNRKIMDQRQDMDVRKFLKAAGGRIILACLFSLALSIAMLFLFRVATAAMVWSILAGVITFGILIAGFLWYRYVHVQETERHWPGFIIVPIIWMVLLVIMVCLVVFLAKKINLVIAVLREARKAVFAMPQLVAIPLVTFFFQLIILTLFGVTHFYMAFSGTLWYQLWWIRAPVIKSNFLMTFTKLFNLWMAFWSFQIIESIQYMVVAGAVCRWYFANNKNRLNNPIFRSVSITLRFHLGSIIFGAMFITFVSIIRRTINFLTGNKIGKLLCDFCLKPTEDFLRFLNKNAFILTAMHGQPFFKSGQRATQIIYKNAFNVASVNFIGDFVLCMVRLLLIFISLLFTYLILQDSPLNWIAYIIVAMLAIMVSNIWLAVFETTIDTILLCFCEDSLLNDGLERPYAMSRDLMQFVENSKRLFEKKG